MQAQYRTDKKTTGIDMRSWEQREIRDLDNLLKGVLDSISAAGVIVDDCQVDEIQMRREGVTKGGKIQVWVWVIEN